MAFGSGSYAAGFTQFAIRCSGVPLLGALLQPKPGENVAVDEGVLASAYAVPPAGSYTVNGAPDCKINTPLASHPPSAVFVTPLALAKNGNWYTALVTKRCRRSKSERPRDAFALFWSLTRVRNATDAVDTSSMDFEYVYALCRYRPLPKRCASVACNPL